MSREDGAARRAGAAVLSAGERRLFDKVAAMVPLEHRHLIPADEAADAFQRRYHAFKPGYDMINLAALPFALTLILSWFLFTLPGVVHALVLLVALVLTSLSLYRLHVFKAATRDDLVAIAARHRRVAKKAA